MMYQGIIISGTDMTECYEIAKNLELSQSYKIVRVVSNSKKKECYHYIEGDKLARIDKECFLIKLIREQSASGQRKKQLTIF